MRFLQISGWTVRPDKNRAFQAWLYANQQRLADCYPEGTSLVGVFAAVFGSEKNAGDIVVVEQLDSYGALDRIAALGKDPDSEYARLTTEMIGFIDPTAGAGWSNTLLKDMLDATVFDMPAADVNELVGAGV